MMPHRQVILMMALVAVLVSALVLRHNANRPDATPELLAADDYAEIELGLFVGGLTSKPPPAVEAVLNVSEFEDGYKAGYHAWRPIADAEPVPSVEWLGQAVEFVEEHHGSGRPTFIHCFAGVSRSGLVAAAYLMKNRRCSRDEALAILRKSRPQIQPHPAFMTLLSEWEKRHKGRR